MDLVSFYFLALIVVVSGGSAYFADWLGRKLGKKRLWIGRLRPRHTAALFVILSGMLISLITITLVATVSSDVRTWLAEGRRAAAEVVSLRNEVGALKSEKTRAESINAALLATLSTRQKLLTTASKTLAAFKSEQSQLQTKIYHYTQQLAGSHELLRRNAIEIRQSNAARKEVQALLANLSGSYERLKSTYANLNATVKQLDSHNSELSDQNHMLAQDNDRFQKANQTLLNARQTMAADKLTLQKDLDDKRQALAALQLELANSKEALDVMKQQIETAGTELTSLEAQAQMLDSTVVSSRTRPIIFSKGEELARVSLGRNLSYQQVQDGLRSLLRIARETAEQHGARSSRPNLPSAAIFVREDPQTHHRISPEDLIEGIARKLVGQSEEHVVVATSSLNAFAGEPVSLEVNAFANPLVYRSGQVVAETRIDGKSDEEVIYQHIADFLKTNVREKLKQSRLLPTADNSYGSMDASQLLKIVRDVRIADRLIRLQVLADSDTRAGDPVRLSFRIRL